MGPSVQKCPARTRQFCRSDSTGRRYDERYREHSVPGRGKMLKKYPWNTFPLFPKWNSKYAVKSVKNKKATVGHIQRLSQKLSL